MYIYFTLYAAASGVLLNYIAICLSKDQNLVSHSNKLVVYSLPTVMSSVIENHRFVHGFFLPVERALLKVSCLTH